MLEYQLLNKQPNNKIISFFSVSLIKKVVGAKREKLAVFLLKCKNCSEEKDLDIKFNILSVLLEDNPKILNDMEECVFSFLLTKNNISPRQKVRNCINHLILNLGCLGKFQEQIYYLINKKLAVDFNYFIEKLKEQNIEVAPYLQRLLDNGTLDDKYIIELFLNNENVILSEKIIDNFYKLQNNNRFTIENVKNGIIYNFKKKNITIIKLLTDKMLKEFSSNNYKEFDVVFFEQFILKDINEQYFQWFKAISKRNKDIIKNNNEIQLKLFLYLNNYGEIEDHYEFFSENNYYDFVFKYSNLHLNIIKKAILKNTSDEKFLKLFPIYMNTKFKDTLNFNPRLVYDDIDFNYFNYFKKFIGLINTTNQHKFNGIKIFELYVCFLVNSYLTINEDNNIVLDKSGNNKDIEDILFEEIEKIKPFIKIITNNFNKTNEKGSPIINRGYFFLHKPEKKFNPTDYTKEKLEDIFTKKNSYENILVGHYMQEYAMLKLLNTFTQKNKNCNLLQFVKQENDLEVNTIKQLFKYVLDQERLIQTGGAYDNEISGDIIQRESFNGFKSKNSIIIEFKKNIDEFSTEIEKKNLISAINMHHIFFHNIYEVFFKYVKDTNPNKGSYGRVKRILNTLVRCFNGLVSNWKDLYFGNLSEDKSEDISIEKILKEKRHYILSYDGGKYVGHNYFEYYLSSYKPLLKNYDSVMDFSIKAEENCKNNEMDFFLYLRQIILLGFIQDYSKETVVSKIEHNGTGGSITMTNILGENNDSADSDGLIQAENIKLKQQIKELNQKLEIKSQHI